MSDLSFPGESVKMDIDVLTPTVDTPASVVDTVAPTVDAPAPVVDAPAPVVDAPAPVVDAPAPVVDTPAPVVDTVAPTVDAPASIVDTVAPVVDAPAPIVDTPAPVVDTSIVDTPVVDAITFGNSSIKMEDPPKVKDTSKEVKLPDITQTKVMPINTNKTMSTSKKIIVRPILTSKDSGKIRQYVFYGVIATLVIGLLYFFYNMSINKSSVVSNTTILYSNPASTQNPGTTTSSHTSDVVVSGGQSITVP